MNCLNCNAETANPKFCSRSCAAIFNNGRVDVKRKLPQGSCRLCGVPIRVRMTYCTEHKRGGVKIVDKTMNSNTGNNSSVRAMARNVYRNSGRPLICALCGYDKHVDICHIKDIRSYPHGTPYPVVNDISNLLALCRNHHWEFDHDFL